MARPSRLYREKGIYRDTLLFEPVLCQIGLSLLI